MRGVILAGGTGSRLGALTQDTNKHLLPVAGRPMIAYAVDHLAASGLDEVIVVTSAAHAPGFVQILGDGHGFGLRRLEYAHQDRPGGIAHALALCEEFAANGPIAVLLGDNIFERSAAPAIARFRADPHGAVIFLVRVDDPRSYGVAVLDGDRVVNIVEKPTDPPSDLAVTGLYLYDRAVFDIIRRQRPSARGELEITGVNNAYAPNLRHERVTGYWIDCGASPAQLEEASRLVARYGANVPRS